MVKLAVISDSHGNEFSIVRALEAVGSCDAVIHLGDHAADAEQICGKLGKPLYAVLGNCDALRRPKGDYSYEQLVEIEGAKLLIMHGHRYGVDSYSTFGARQRALELHADALLYGHTHYPEASMKDGMLVMNPGSTSLPRRGSRRSAGLLIIENGKLYPRLFPID